MITLTHVCRTWRELFTAEPSLWTYLDLDNMGGDKARVYLERSRSYPIGLSVRRDEDMSSHDPLFWVIPQVIGRLKSLSIDGEPENVQDITAHISRPAPLLEDLSISSSSQFMPPRSPVLTSTFFDGDLSSLRKLRLDSALSELPWRNMVNLTSFTMYRLSPQGVTITQLLDFFEGAPRLHEVDLYSVTLSSGVQKGRLVSLACLKKMAIAYCRSPSVLLDHLVIPVGAQLRIEAKLLSSLIGDLLPRSLDNLKNFPNFTAIKLSIDGPFQDLMTFDGPNGQVSMILGTDSRISLILESLAQLDTSKTERFRIEDKISLSGEVVYRALLPMGDLRALTLYECYSLHVFIRALHPSANLPDVVVCPKLQELVLVLYDDGEVFDMEGVVGMAEARASRGKKLETVRIIDGRDEPDPDCVLELRKHVGHVGYSHQVRAIYDESMDGDDED